MARQHVYSDPHWLAGDRLKGKLAVTAAPGARHASVRFVTGSLDRVDSRAALLDLARRANGPILVVYGEQAPPKSRAESEVLASLPSVEVERLPYGNADLTSRSIAGAGSLSVKTSSTYAGSQLPVRPTENSFDFAPGETHSVAPLSLLLLSI